MKKILICMLSMLACSFCFSQSADVITEILDSPNVTYGQVCYLSAVYRGLVSDDASYADAYNAMFENKEITTGFDLNAPAKYVDAAYFMSKLWEIKGGFFFRVTKGSARYAFKQLKLDGVIPKYIDPDRLLSGVDILNLYTLGDAKYNRKGGAQ